MKKKRYDDEEEGEIVEWGFQNNAAPSIGMNSNIPFIASSSSWNSRYKVLRVTLQCQFNDSSTTNLYRINATLGILNQGGQPVLDQAESTIVGAVVAPSQAFVNTMLSMHTPDAPTVEWDKYYLPQCTDPNGISISVTCYAPPGIPFAAGDVVSTYLRITLLKLPQTAQQ